MVGFTKAIDSNSKYLNILQQLENQKTRFRENEKKNIPLPIIPLRETELITGSMIEPDDEPFVPDNIDALLRGWLKNVKEGVLRPPFLLSRFKEIVERYPFLPMLSKEDQDIFKQLYEFVEKIKGKVKPGQYATIKSLMNQVLPLRFVNPTTISNNTPSLSSGSSSVQPTALEFGDASQIEASPSPPTPQIEAPPAPQNLSSFFPVTPSEESPPSDEIEADLSQTEGIDYSPIFNHDEIDAKAFLAIFKQFTDRGDLIMDKLGYTPRYGYVAYKILENQLAHSRLSRSNEFKMAYFIRDTKGSETYSSYVKKVLRDGETQEKYKKEIAKYRSGFLGEMVNSAIQMFSPASGAQGSGLKQKEGGKMPSVRQLLSRLENLIAAHKLGNKNKMIKTEIKTILDTLISLNKISDTEKKNIMSVLR
jgi:hypothetical protein